MEALKHTLNQLKERLSYNKDTGEFFWRSLPCSLENNQWNSKFAGKRAGSYTDNVEYAQIRLQNTLYLVHRLVWLFEKGTWPKGVIDHIDGNTRNNMIFNLRDVDRITNSRNCHLSKNNTSGFNGVYLQKQNRTWVAEGHSTVGGKKVKKYLGSFSNLLDAVAAREEWDKEQGNFTSRHGKS